MSENVSVMRAGWNKMTRVAVVAMVCLWAAMPQGYAGGDTKQLEQLRKQNEALSRQNWELISENRRLRESSEESLKKSGLWMTAAAVLAAAALVFGAVSYAKGLRKGAEVQARAFSALQGAHWEAPKLTDGRISSPGAQGAPGGEMKPGEPRFRS